MLARKRSPTSRAGSPGPAYTAFTTKELRELGQIADVDMIVDPA